MAEPSFAEIMGWTPNEASAYLESMRWPDGPVCPEGCSGKVYRITAKTRRKKANGETKAQPTRHLLKCSQCKRQFTVKVGSIFEDSHVPLNKWLGAIYLMCASKKGVSAHQLHRMLGVTYRTAWYMAHRVRLAMKDDGSPLSGVIEADETYVGGRPRGHRRRRIPGTKSYEKAQRKYHEKVPVVGILERGGRVRPVVMREGLAGGKVRDVLAENIDLEQSQLVTDESPLYDSIRRLLPHKTVKHATEYITADGIHTQGIEGFWSLLKRQLYGIHHHVSAGLLPMYADEAAFKYNGRKISDGERFAEAMRGAEGRRLAWFASSSSAKESPPAS